MKILLISLLVFCFWQQTAAQSGRVGQFAIWNPLQNKKARFEAGYKRHLLWHQRNGDIWDWYGWYFISGGRSGRFIDATFGHQWADFDAAVHPAGDARDNARNVGPAAVFETAWKFVVLPELSTPGKSGLNSKYLRMLTLKTTGLQKATPAIRKAMQRYSPSVRTFQTLQVADGGDLNELTILIGFERFAELQQTADVVEFFADPAIFQAVKAELLVFRKDLSLFPAH
ncbi:hypothetical protein C7T94_13505 [Pedobacter yulinensis]|uniref:NIPSNAP domain-containing protein n=1 Tax=Pedobacter yulinensis TaxID=2126353 RepID=A0A2T3HM89_9SPHI|nr:hypothetical protein [Pedobacter yulinensis]PST83557.1 hypothetical protein C7T94_13505 [Pedobacter yulinensis]